MAASDVVFGYGDPAGAETEFDADQWAELSYFVVDAMKHGNRVWKRNRPKRILVDTRRPRGNKTYHMDSQFHCRAGEPGPEFDEWFETVR